MWENMAGAQNVTLVQTDLLPRRCCWRDCPASEDGVQLGAVNILRPDRREPAESSGRSRRTGAGRPPRVLLMASAARTGGPPPHLLHQALQGFGHLMMEWGGKISRSLRQLLVGKEDSRFAALSRMRVPLPASATDCPRPKFALSAATIDCRGRAMEEISSGAPAASSVVS